MFQYVKRFTPFSWLTGFKAAVVDEIIRLLIKRTKKTSSNHGNINHKTISVEATFEPRHGKTNNVDSDQVSHKPGCTATGDG